MDYKDYYKTLGVSKTASEKEIKAAYRKLARKHHPDMNQGNAKAEARFKEINEAYEVLSDPEKRKRYDQLGADWKTYARQPRGGAGAWPGGGGVRVEYDFGGGGAPSGFSDFFKTFFGGGGFGGFGGVEEAEEPFASVRAADVEHAVELTLAEVLKGATRTLAIGDGPKPRQVEVKIPAGVREGQRVRVAGEGAAGRGGKRGDLYLRVRLRPDPAFERKGDDLQTTVRVPLTTAVLGGEAQVPTLDGPVGIKIPPGTSAGQTFRLRGHGLPHLESGGGRGDLLASLAVDLPKRLSAKEKELFEELRRLGA
ncbi:MAG TPA: J domain-containing protein [Thermoanaerobaculia bacterium]